MSQFAYKKQLTDLSLSQTSFSGYVSSYSYEAALTRGLIVDVSQWVPSKMGFGDAQVAVTANLWESVVQGCMKMKDRQHKQSYEKDFLYRAAAAIDGAKRLGKEATTFSTAFPWTECKYEEVILRVECSVSIDKKQVITIGYPEEFQGL